MAKFKVGDEVRVTTNKIDDGLFYGEIGTVVEANRKAEFTGAFDYRVMLPAFADRHPDGILLNQDELEFAHAPVGPNGKPDLSDRWESGAHMTLFDREHQLSFTYYPSSDYIYVAQGGYGEPNIMRIPVPHNVDRGKLSIQLFESICKGHCITWKEE